MTLKDFVLSPFLINELKIELPNYLATAEDISSQIKLEWWKKHEHVSGMLVKPSSAAAERVFSILSNCFAERQTSSLEDYIETSVMLQYNSN